MRYTVRVYKVYKSVIKDFISEHVHTKGVVLSLAQTRGMLRTRDSIVNPGSCHKNAVIIIGCMAH